MQSTPTPHELLTRHGKSDAALGYPDTLVLGSLSVFLFPLSCAAQGGTLARNFLLGTYVLYSAYFDIDGKRVGGALLARA